MKLHFRFAVIFFCLLISQLIKAQTPDFSNVLIGLNGVADGIKIQANFPSYNGGWARGFHIANENSSLNYITLGSIGGCTNGKTTLSYSFIGTDYDNTYMSFLPSGNVGIGTNSPSAKLHINTDNVGMLLTSNNAFMRWNNHNLSLTANSSWSWVPYIEWVTNTGKRQAYIGWNPAYFNLTLENGYNFGIIGGNVGIGTPNPTYKLDVKGTIHACEVVVDVANGCDFVFDGKYKLMDLKTLESYIKEHKHLPEIASEKEMIETGVNMKELQMKFLQKIEELTLYSIDQQKKIEQQNKTIDSQSAKITELEKQSEKIKVLEERLRKIESALK